MKMVIAYIQPFMSDGVEAALHRIEGLTGATFVDVRGFGRGRQADPRDAEVLRGTVPKVRIEVIVPDELEAAVVRAIEGAARTGNRGDGKVVVIPVSRALRVATGEEGDAAV